jgi:hypothetical protein
MSVTMPVNMEVLLVQVTHSTVMAGLVPAIHVFLIICGQDVDARHKAGHDELGRFYARS